MLIILRLHPSRSLSKMLYCDIKPLYYAFKPLYYAWKLWRCIAPGSHYITPDLRLQIQNLIEQTSVKRSPLTLICANFGQLCCLKMPTLEVTVWGQWWCLRIIQLHGVFWTDIGAYTNPGQTSTYVWVLSWYCGLNWHCPSFNMYCYCCFSFIVCLCSSLSYNLSCTCSHFWGRINLSIDQSERQLIEMGVG